MNLTFIDYQTSDSGVTLHFQCLNPGPDKPTEYYLDIADTDLSSFTSAAQFGAFVIAKLKRKLQANGIATVLDQFKGRTVTI
jgi:hypothetical protein